MNYYDVIFAQQKAKKDSKYFGEISDAINVLAGTETTYTPSEMASAILDAIPTETASGNPTHITDAANFPAESVVTTLEPVQEGNGDPSPENVRPITGHTGVYLVNGENISSDGTTTLEPAQEGSGDPSPENVRPILPALSFERDNGEVMDVYGCEVDWTQGVLRVTKVKQKLQNMSTDQSKTGFIRVTQPLSNPKVPQTSQTLLSNVLISDYVGIIGFNGNTSKPYSFWYNERAVYVVLSTDDFATVRDWNTYLNSNDVYIIYELAAPIEIALSSSELERVKEALKTETHSVTFPQAQSPVYGCEVDWVNGVLRVTDVNVDLGTWAYTQNQTDAHAFNSPYIPPDGDTAPKSTTEAICEIYKLYTSTTLTQYDYGFAISNSRNYFFFKNKDISSPSDFKTAMSGVYMVYKLATPLEISLTPEVITLLKGENNVWTDAGESEIEYKVDLNSYIQKLIEEASASASALSVSPLSLGKSAVLTSNDGEDGGEIEDVDEPASADEESVEDTKADEPAEESKEAEELTVKKEIAEELAETEKVEEVKETEERESEVEE